MDVKKVGKAIAFLRKRAGYTQKDLADRIGISDKAVSKWERGLGCPDISLLEDLSKILDVSILELLKGEKIDNKRLISNEDIINSMYTQKITTIEKVKNISNFIAIISVIIFVLIVVVTNIKSIYMLNKTYNMHEYSEINIYNEYQEKVELILKNASLRNYLLFILGINCGLRISDILSLNVGDVRGKTHIQIIEKKTGKFKKFPVNSKLKPMIEEFTKGRRYDEPLFMTIFGNRLERVAAYYIVRDACEKAGLETKVGTHTMRKTFGYHHYQKFKDIAMLQKMFNHSSPLITLRYIGIEQDQIEESYSNFIL